MYKIAVYGTLKKPYWNHRIIADQKFVWEDLIEFSVLDNVGFPRAKFESWTNKWLTVEIYKIDEDALARCDRLEWNGNHYQRKIVKTKWWLDVWVYEIMWDIPDQSEEYREDTNIYNWKR